MFDDDENILIGKTLTGIALSSDKQAILFKTTGEDIRVDVYGDCCSYSWVENVELPVNGFPAVVTKAGGIDMPDLGNGDAELRQYYGFKIETDKGDIVIDYRNDSNGYYGGSLSWPGDYGHNSDINDDWIEVK